MMNVSAPLMRKMEKQRRYRSTGGHRTRGLMRSRRSRRALDAILVALRLPPPSPPLHQTVTMARQPRRGCAARNLAANKQRRHPAHRAVAMSPPAPPEDSSPLNQTPLHQKMEKGTPGSPHFPKKNPSILQHPNLASDFSCGPGVFLHSHLPNLNRMCLRSRRRLHARNQDKCGVKRKRPGRSPLPRARLSIFVSWED